MVEQGTHKPLVASSTLASATNLMSVNAALPRWEGRIDFFIELGGTIRGRRSSVWMAEGHRCRDVRHRAVVTLDAILGLTCGARPSLVQPEAQF